MSTAIHRNTDEVHLCTVVVPAAVPSATYPMAPMASSAAVVAVHHSMEAQRCVEGGSGGDH